MMAHDKDEIGDQASNHALSLAGKVAVVTGANSGIGAEIALQMAAAHAAVLLVARDAGRLAAVSEQIRMAGGHCQTHVCDISSDDSPNAVIRAALASFSRIDILVHSAGAFAPEPFRTASLERLDEQWRVNVRAPFALTQAAIPHFDDGGVVIFISSTAGSVGHAGSSAYCATKGAVEQLTRALACEFASSGVRVNCIAPGATRTRMNELLRANDPQWEAEFGELAPCGRWATPDEIAPAAVFLASDAASFIHGAVLHVDGGWTAQ